MNDEEVIAAPPESAPGSESATDQTKAQDAIETSSPSPGAAADQSPPADDELAQFKQTVKEAVGETQTDSTETDTKSDGVAPNKTDEQAETAKTEETGSDALSQEPLRIDQRPEWQKLVAIADKVGPEAGKETRAVLRTLLKRENDLNQAVARAKPAQEVVREMFQSVGGSEVGFKNMRQLITTFDSNPAAAVPMLKKLLIDAEQRGGLVIQSPEFVTEAKALDQQVADGTITPEAAQKRKSEILELEQTRAAQKRQSQNSAAEQQRQRTEQQQREAQQSVELINKAESDWTAAKLKSDPDFAAVQNLTVMAIKSGAPDFWTETKGKPTVKQVNEFLEKCFKAAKDEAVKFRPKARARQAITDNGNGSSGNNRTQPETELDEFKAETQKAFERHRR